MATMNLKTYRSDSMANALAEVKRDLGKDAVILHTRSYRVGSVLGVGGKNVVEITASDQKSAKEMKGAARSTARAPIPSGAPVAGTSAEGGIRSAVASRPAPPIPAIGHTNSVQRPHTKGSNRLVTPPTRTRSDSSAEFAPTRFADAAKPIIELKQPGTVPATRAPIAPEDDDALASLQSEIASVKRLVGQVLACSRRTAATIHRTDDGSGGVLALGGMAEPLFAMYMRMQDGGVAADIAESIAGAVRDELTPAELADQEIVRQAVLRRLAAMIPVTGGVAKAGARPDGRPLTIALVGPTGVGKTTTIAKLAAAYKLRHNKRVGLITSDTYRIAAVDQLRTYANIIGLPLKVAMTPVEMKACVESLSDMDVILIDTAGRSQHDSARVSELASFVQAASPHESHLVLSSTVSEAVLMRTAERFRPLSPGRAIFTKLDEAVCFGVIVNIIRKIGVPISFLTTGQEVPDQIEVADSHRIARFVLDGPAAGE